MKAEDIMVLGAENEKRACCLQKSKGIEPEKNGEARQR